MRSAPVLVALLLVACRSAPETRIVAAQPLLTVAAAVGGQKPTALHLTLIGTNDIHGWVQPHLGRGPNGDERRQGGTAAFAGYLKLLRDENPGGVVLLDGGDLFQGTLVSNLTEGAVVIDVYNRLGYMAAALGNHEFDYGPVGPISIASAPGLDPFGALKERQSQAQFPLLAVNVYDAETGARPTWLKNDGTTLIDVKGVKVGIIGLITPQTPTTTSPVNVSSLRFGSLVPEASIAAARLRARGAELVIIVTHAGGRCEKVDNPHDLSSCDIDGGEVFELLNGLPEDTVDAVIAGHTHQVLGHFVHGTPVIETSGQMRSFGRIDLYLDPQDHLVYGERTLITPGIPICENVDPDSGRCDPTNGPSAHAATWVPAQYLGKPVVADRSIDALMAPALAKVERDQARTLGVQVPVRLHREYEAESPLGSMLADSLRDMEHADVALMNSGGIRADFPAGELTYGAVYEVLPFDNTVATLTLSGEELRRLLHAAYGAKKGVFQVSGLRVKLARCPGRDRLRSVTLASGDSVQGSRRYKVVLPDFLARGGDGLSPALSTLNPGRIDLGSDRPLNFRDALVAHWQHRKEALVGPPSGRVAFVDDGGHCGDEPSAASGSAAP